MPNALAPERAERIVQMATDMYLRRRKKLIEMLTVGDNGPYGTVKLTLMEQLRFYMALDEAGWQKLLEQAVQVHRGELRAYELAMDDLREYDNRMQKLQQQFQLG